MVSNCLVFNRCGWWVNILSIILFDFESTITCYWTAPIHSDRPYHALCLSSTCTCTVCIYKNLYLNASFCFCSRSLLALWSWSATVNYCNWNWIALLCKKMYYTGILSFFSCHAIGWWQVQMKGGSSPPTLPLLCCCWAKSNGNQISKYSSTKYKTQGPREIIKM